MKLIGENIHIISKKTREAIENKDEDYIKRLASVQTGMDWIDLNIGPARHKEGTFEWLLNTLKGVFDKPFSFDTTNFSEMESALSLVSNPADCIINSTNAEMARLEPLSKLAAKHNSYLIGLTLSESGIPKTADERYELASIIIEQACSNGVDGNKIISSLELSICEGVDSMGSSSSQEARGRVTAVSNIKERTQINMRPKRFLCRIRVIFRMSPYGGFYLIIL